MSQDSREYEYPGTPFPFPVVEEPSTRYSAQIGQNNQQPSKSPFWKRLTFWNVLFNFILAITTALLGLIAYWQLESSKEAISASRSANTISTEALRVSQESFRISEESLRASKKTAEDTARSFQLDQRSWIGFKDFILTLEAGKPIKAEIVLTNTGKTPALKSKLTAIFKTGPIPNVKTINFEKEINPFNRPYSVTTIFPNATTRSRASAPNNLKEADFIGIQTGILPLYIVGKVVYSDVFGKMHTTWLCVSYVPSSNAFGYCEQNNDAD